MDLSLQWFEESPPLSFGRGRVSLFEATPALQARPSARGAVVVADLPDI